MKKRIFSLFLALVMLFSCLSLNIFAAEEEEPTTEPVAGNTGGGRLSSTELIEKIGAENVIADVDFTGMTAETKTFSGINSGKSKISFSNTNGNLRIETNESTGNSYVVYGPTVSSESDSAYFQIADSAVSGQSTMANLIKNEDPRVGASYVFSYDFTPLSTGCYNEQLLEVASYLGLTSTSKTVQLNFLRTMEDGTLNYYSGSTYKNNSTGIKLEVGRTYNFTIHHKPKSNTYDLYVKGDGKEFVKQGIQAISTTVIDNFNGQCIYNTDVLAQPEINFTPTFIRFKPRLKTVTADLYTVDNIRVYRSEEYLDCEHTYEPTSHTHDYENDTVTVGYECTKCGKTYQEEAEENYCALCGGVAISDDVVITGRSATLGELIDMNVYANISDALVKTEGATATITCGDKTETVALNGAEKTEIGYKFSLPLRSTQMADDVTLTIDGATYTTSIADYANELIATDSEAAPVAKALLNYGAAAQAYFAEKNGDETLVDVLANAGLTDADQVVAPLDAETLSEYEFTQSGDTDKACFTGAKLQLASKTHMKLYFKASAGATVTVNEETVPVHYDSTEKEYYVFLSDITPTLALTYDAYTVVVTSGTTEFRTTLSAMTAVLAGTQDNDQKLSNLMNAYGQYCLKATNYDK